MKSMVHLDAGHNVNGNPRRGWLIFDQYGYPDKVTGGYLEEDYTGEAALKKLFGVHGRDFMVLCRLKVPFREIMEARKLREGRA